MGSYLSPDIIKEGDCQVLIDVGSSSTKIYLECEGEIFGDKDDWVYVDKEVVDIGGQLARVVRPDDLQQYVETLSQLTASRYILTSLLHSLVVVANTQQGEMAVAFMCDPNLEPDWQEDRVSQLLSDRTELAELVQNMSRSWLHKLVALLQNYPAIAKELGLPEDPANISLVTTIPGYIILKLRGDDEGYIPGNEPKIPNLSIEFIQELLVKFGFPINSIVQLLDTLIIEGNGDKPEVATYSDTVVEMLAIQKIVQHFQTQAVAISTDTVYKAIVISDEPIDGLKNSIDGIYYSSARTGFGNLCGVILSPLLENKEDFLGLRIKLNIYELVDEFVQKSFDEGLLDNFDPDYHFFACESGDYLCVDHDGNQIILEQEAQKLIDQNNVGQYKNLVLSVILGSAFSLRQKSDYVYHQAYRNNEWQGQPADTVVYYGGFLQHSVRGDGKIGGGITRLFIGTHDEHTNVMMTPFYTAAEAASIVGAKEARGEEIMLEHYQPTVIDRETGIFSTQYQEWQRQVKRKIDEGVMLTTSLGGIELIYNN